MSTTKHEGFTPDVESAIHKCAQGIITTESACIEWGAINERSVELASEAIGNLLRLSQANLLAQLEAVTAERDALAIKVAGFTRGPEFYAYTKGAISDFRLEGMIDETRWWKVPGDEVYEVVRELKDLRNQRKALLAANAAAQREIEIQAAALDKLRTDSPFGKVTVALMQATAEYEAAHKSSAEAV